MVYGDTDSVSILLKDRSKDKVFDIGEEMAKVIDLDNLPLMKIKFEKVYLPCILQTKKRYLGYMNQVKPVYDANEKVRRDGIQASFKILEKTIELLFDIKNIIITQRRSSRSH